MTDKWDSPKLQKQLADKVERNMRKAMPWLVGKVKRKINVGNAKGTDPSLPGFPPKKVTGRLFQSIVQRVDRDKLGVTGQVGSHLEYARRLELGFIGTDSKGRNVVQAPRPYLRAALLENGDALMRFLLKG